MNSNFILFWSSTWFDFRPLKVGNPPDFVACRQHATYRWKALNKGYNFMLDLVIIGSLHAKLCAPKVVGILVVGISGLPLGSPKTKSHLMWPPWRGAEYTIRGKVVVRAVGSLMSPSCLWFVLTPKVLQLCTNHFVLILCKFAWVVEACQFFLVPSWSSNTPFYPSKVLWARERALTPYSSVVFSLDSHLSRSRNWERVNQTPCNTFILFFLNHCRPLGVYWSHN